jgi:hypothetical protein
MIHPDVPVVLLKPGLNGMSSLSDVDLTTFTWHAVNARCFPVKVMFDRLKETSNLPRWEAYSFDVMSH